VSSATFSAPPAADESLRPHLAAGIAIGAAWRLALAARSRGGRAGSRAGTGPGSSLEFEEYRDYHPGDDLRRLDWGVYARTDRLVLRTEREEVSPRCDLVVDVSRSMGLSADKAAATWKVAGLLATAARAAGLDVAAWRAAGEAVPLAGAGAEPLAWRPLDLDGDAGPERALPVMPPLRRGGVRLLVSDLLFPADPEWLVRSLVAGAAAATVVQVLADAEAAPEAVGEVRLRDVESGALRDLFVDGAAVEAYRRALAGHVGRWAVACRRHMVGFVELRSGALAGDAREALGALATSGLLTPAPGAS
jgi:uncharacterized protein (DUF58 family)